MTTMQFDEFLEHYGVKGMKWGVRRKRGADGRVETTPVMIKAEPGKRVQTKGGTGQPATPDAIRTAALKQKARASTTDALTTKELQDLTQRLQLEANYQKLIDGPQKKKGESFIDKLLDAEVKAATSGQAGPTMTTINGVKKVLSIARG